MTHGSPLKRENHVVMTVVLVTVMTTCCAAQTVVYPSGYLSSNSSRYPSTYQTSPTYVAQQSTPPRTNLSPQYYDNTADATSGLSRTAISDQLTNNGGYRQQSYDPRSPWNDIRQPAMDPNSSYGIARIQSAQNSVEQFRRMAQSTSSVIAKIANENAEFAQHWVLLAQKYDLLYQRLYEARLRHDETARDLNDVRSKIAQYGMTSAIGWLLQQKKEQLDTWQATDLASVFATEELTRSRAKTLELEMVRYDGSDVTSQTSEILAEARMATPAFQQATLNQNSIVTQLRDLLYQRSRWLASLKQGYRDYQQSLSELDSAVNASAALIREYRTLIARHIIWIRSGHPLNAKDFRNATSGLAAIFNSQRSADIGFTLKRKWDADPATGYGLLAWIALILILRWRAVTWIVGVGTRQKLRDATAGTRKLVASVLTPLAALALPTILYLIAQWLSDGIVSESTLHSSSGVFAASLVALFVEMPRQLLRGNGFIDKHIDVKLPRRQRAAAYLTLIGFGLILAAYVITVTSLINHGLWRNSTARIELILVLLLVAWTNHLALRPSGGFLEPLIAKLGGGVIHQVRFVIYLLGVGLPLAMIALSAMGYGFTANIMITRAIITVVSLVIAGTLWSGMKIVSSRVWQMLTGTTVERKFDEYGEIPVEPGSSVLAEHYLELKHHLAFLCQCALVLLAVVCVGWLWIDIFPNVRMGNPVVWTVQDTVVRTSVNSAGYAFNHPVSVSTSITVAHLLLAAATLFVAFQLAKLLPALFDALVLQRVSFDEGMEHLSLVLGRVLLFGIGCLVACALIGVRWQTIQWLAVGLTIGIGFGLQDMVRNLFGGIVVLFEKPARLGDLITVGRITGRVAAQRFRSTVLSDEDGREVIVPNKNFVSEEVVNWMGAGRLQAIAIEVAVKRDLRPADICRSLQQLVVELPDVLLTPGPQATLVCVGRSFQRIEVRAWIEENREASCFRDSLLQAVSKYLRDNELFYTSQPTQPILRDVGIDGLANSYGTQTSKSRKRSA